MRIMEFRDLQALNDKNLEEYLQDLLMSLEDAIAGDAEVYDEIAEAFDEAYNILATKKQEDAERIGRENSSGYMGTIGSDNDGIYDEIGWDADDSYLDDMNLRRPQYAESRKRDKTAINEKCVRKQLKEHKEAAARMRKLAGLGKLVENK